MNDPKMTGDKEVRAQIKLLFQTSSGKAMLCTRSMQLLMKRTTMTFKTLEGQLQVVNNGEKTILSTKVAELDSQVPLNLGVSRAVLEYVIFCHQEDSLWPLSEPATLKKRFDEIFEALKFTKSLDSIKTLRKNAAAEIKLLDQSVKHLESDKNKADRQRKHREELITAAEELEAEADELTQRITNLNEELARIFKLNQDFQAVLARLENMRFQNEAYKEQIRRLERSIISLSESEEELRLKLGDRLKQVAQLKDKITAREQEAKQKSKALLTKRLKQSGLLQKQGQLKGEYRIGEEKKLELDTLMKESELILGSENVERFIKGLKEVLSQRSNDYEIFKKARERRIGDLQSEIQELASSVANEESHRKYTIEDINRLETEINKLQTSINKIDADESGIEYERAQILCMKRRLVEMKEKKELEGVATRIREIESEILAAEAEVDSVNKQISVVSRQADSYAKLALLKEEIENRQEVIKTLYLKHAENFKIIFDAELTGEANSIFSETLEVKSALIVETEKAKEKASKTQTDLEARLNMLEGEFERKKRKMEAYEKKIKRGLPLDVGIDEYEEYLKELESDYSDIQMSQSTKEFNKKAITVAEEKHFCALCQRGLTSKELKDFVNRVQGLIARLDNENEAKEIEQELKATRELGPLIRDFKELQTELPTLEKQVSDLRNENTDAVINAQAIIERLKEAKKSFKEAESYKQLLGDITRLEREVRELTTQLDARSSELEQLGSTVDSRYQNKSSDELQAMQFEVNAKVRSLRERAKNAQQEREDILRAQSALEGDLKDRKLKIHEMEKLIVDRERMERELKEKEMKMDALSETVQEIDNRLEEIKVGERSAREKVQQYIEKSKVELEQKEAYKARVEQELNHVLELSKAIEKWEKGKKALQEVEETVSRIQEEISAEEEEIEKIANEINKLKEDLANQDQIEKNILENLLLREVRRSLDQLQQEIEDLELQNAEAEAQDYERKVKRLQTELAEVQGELGGKMGEIKQMRAQAENIEQELQGEYKDVYKAYHEEWVALQVQRIVDADLAQYAKSLDAGIMKYHSAKMQEINKIIDELWHATYRGTDVDTIQIRSDVNLQSKGNRTYNYRVVMKKSDTELDMRGRCSAGQKVLALIIIRLALAESFGVNCGMIALDEPTTNLDVENSEGLAQSLGRLIDMRRHQKNFQLIVITHDEKFLRHMDASKYTDHFYRVSRNERQMSQIELVDISRVGE